MSPEQASAKQRIDYEVVGRRIKDRRLKFKLSTSQLAERAGVARYTVIRVEQGNPCTSSTLRKIRLALRLFSDQMIQPYPEGPFAVHRFENTKWSISISKDRYQQRLNDDDPLHVNDADERRRLGRLGFQPFFTAILGSELPGGVGGHALMELHQASWVDSHPGEEFIYCLRSSVTIMVDDKSCVLQEGDSMCFDASLPHQYLPTQVPGPADPIPLILLVVSLRPGESIQGLS